MSNEETQRGIDAMTASGKITPSVARTAMQNPVEAEKLIRLEDIRDETAKQSVALFGSEPLGIPGLVKDVRALKLLVYRSQWVIAGGVAVGGFFIATAITIVGLWIEYAKH